MCGRLLGKSCQPRAAFQVVQCPGKAWKVLPAWERLVGNRDFTSHSQGAGEARPRLSGAGREFGGFRAPRQGRTLLVMLLQCDYSVLYKSLQKGTISRWRVKGKNEWSAATMEKVTAGRAIAASGRTGILAVIAQGPRP
ncbi:hypothetical protein C8R45DRAFT_936767 [Mycena sanguinolenta]|nr:hypothetical protein C8R45DRAFT_936767 [Mycena sanguinolenta]